MTDSPSLQALYAQLGELVALESTYTDRLLYSQRRDEVMRMIVAMKEKENDSNN